MLVEESCEYTKQQRNKGEIAKMDLKLAVLLLTTLHLTTAAGMPYVSYA